MILIPVGTIPVDQTIFSIVTGCSGVKTEVVHHSTTGNPLSSLVLVGIVQVVIDANLFRTGVGRGNPRYSIIIAIIEGGDHSVAVSTCP